ncbi:MAG: cytochrome b, partial [Pseudomonadota bacterium]
PEWYFLPFYAILRAITFDILWIIPAKLGGVLLMFGAIAVMALAPWLDTSRVRSGKYRPTFKWAYWVLVIDFVVLMWCGSQPAEGIVPLLSLIGTVIWFGYFLVVLPLLGISEKPLAQPKTIEDDFDAHYPPKAEPSATPAE